MAIIISSKDDGTHKVDQNSFGLEDKLQDYIYKNPDAIPLYDIDEDTRLFIAAREFATRSGPIDALGFDADGNIYVIETKLFKNPDKRQVVAQALDYGASLWRHATDFDDFIARLDTHCQKVFNQTFEHKYAEFFELEDAALSLTKIRNNLAEGIIKFVVLMDSLHGALKDLVIYVNQNSKFDIYAVELEYYKHQKYEIVIPKIFGSEVKKDVSIKVDDNKFDNQKILNWIEELDLSYVDIDYDRTTKTYIRFTTPKLNSIMPPRDELTSSWKSGTAYYYEILCLRSGAVKVQLALNSEGVNQTQAAGQSRIINTSQRTPQKSDWIWFVAKGWKIDYQNGDEALKSSLAQVLKQEIPAFESKFDL